MSLNDILTKEEVIKPGCQFSCYDMMTQLTDFGQKTKQTQETNLKRRN